MEREQIRLNKYLAQCGVGSRRQADILVEQGLVVINGKVAEKGQTVSPEDEIIVDGKRLEGREPIKVLAFYKPAGIICTERDPHADKIITDVLYYPWRVTYAGRLDKDSEGLMLMTNDGELSNAIMEGENGHEKEYLVRVDREITDAFLFRMTGGIYLKDLGITTKECKVEKVSPFIFRIILTQGVNRQIKRMCLSCGYHVENIMRVRIMNIRLGKLKPGEYREISGEELRVLYKGAGLKCREHF